MSPIKTWQDREVDRSFTYDEHGRCIPTLTLFFAPDDWDSRDNFAAKLAAPSTCPEMSDDLHIAYMAGYNAGKLAHGIALPPPAK